MTFAFINEAWGSCSGSNDKNRRKKASCENYKKLSKEVTIKPSVLDINPYESNNNNNFIEYDDFYKSDFQYSSKVESQKDQRHEQVITTEDTYQTHVPEEERVYEPPSQPVYEHFNPPSPQPVMNPQREQMYLEFILYVVCGIFMILILEQFMQLGSKFIK